MLGRFEVDEANSGDETYRSGDFYQTNASPRTTTPNIVANSADVDLIAFDAGVQEHPPDKRTGDSGEGESCEGREHLHTVRRRNAGEEGNDGKSDCVHREGDERREDSEGPNVGLGHPFSNDDAGHRRRHRSEQRQQYSEFHSVACELVDKGFRNAEAFAVYGLDASLELAVGCTIAFMVL